MTRHAGAPCPGCGKLLDATTGVRELDLKPKPGDVSVCIYCAELLVFGEDMTVHAATLKELAEIPLELHREVDRIRERIRANRKRGVDVLMVKTPKVAPEMILGSCDRCGCSMFVMPQMDTHGAARIDTCGPCSTAAVAELTFPPKRGDPIVWPAHWARAKRERGNRVR